MNLRCLSCQRTYPYDIHRWRCECGGVFELEGAPGFAKDEVEMGDFSLWRYRAMLPVKYEESVISLGEGFTPLVETQVYGTRIHCKLEFLAPTGSFKDRGTAVLINVLTEMGVKRVVEDSSGNAGASLAAYAARSAYYAARAGIEAEIYVPAYASPNKLAQIAVYGARLVKVEGPRERAAQAVQEAAAQGAYYASHYYNPFTLEGLKTIAYEIGEQLGWHAPDNLVLPVGHGTLLLGAYRGFKDLLAAGLIERLPRLFAVQAETCAPLHEAYRRGLDDAFPIEKNETVAEGITIAQPVRGRQILAAVRETGGAVLAVSDEETLRARDELARRGLYVEPTSAVAIAALLQLRGIIGPEELTVVPLTGSGLKNQAKAISNG
ncbi:MAG: threonine synthase [Anaerolineae bacterium]